MSMHRECVRQQLYRITFDKYIEQYNKLENYQRAQICFRSFIQKLKTDFNQIKEAKLFRFLLWLKQAAGINYADDWNFEALEIKSHLNQFGIEAVEFFDDGFYVFSITFSDFISDYYNDFEDESGKPNLQVCCLTAHQFNKFIDYGLYLFATLLLKEDDAKDVDPDEVDEIIYCASQDKKLKAIVETNAKQIIDDKELFNGATDYEWQNVNYPYYRGATLLSFETMYLKFKEYKEIFKSNDKLVAVIPD